jgi:hypothetical protein
MATAAQTNRTRKKGRNLFLASLALTGNVGLSVLAAGVGRSTVYEWRRSDEKFSTAWDSALEEAADILEAEARRRAVEGTLEPVFYQGEEVGTVRRYSDTLLIWLMKACDRRKYDPAGYVHLRVFEDIEQQVETLEKRCEELKAQRSREPLR